MRPAILINGVELGTLGFKVREARGIWNTPTASSEGTQIPHRAGQLVPPAETVKIASRTIDIIGWLRGTSRADFLTKLDVLKALLIGPLTVVRAEDPTREHRARLLSLTMTETGPVFLQRTQELILSLFCDDPYAYDASDQTVNFTAATAVPLGTGPSAGVITITGAAADPVLTLKDPSGTVLETMGFTRTLGAGDTLTIDLERFLVTLTVGAVDTNDLPAMTSGGFFNFDPLHCDVFAGDYPTIEVSAGTGQLVYRRAYV
jgi:hypothetical protein